MPISLRPQNTLIPLLVVLLLSSPLTCDSSLTCRLKPVVNPSTPHVSKVLQSNLDAPHYDTPNGLPNGEISLYARFKLDSDVSGDQNILQITASQTGLESFSFLTLKYESTGRKLSIKIGDGREYLKVVEFDVSELKASVFYFVALGLNLKRGNLNVYLVEDHEQTSLKGERYTPENLKEMLKKLNKIPQEISKLELFSSEIPFITEFPGISGLTFWPGCTEHFPIKERIEIIPLPETGNTVPNPDLVPGFTSCSALTFSHFEFILQFFDHPELLPIFSTYQNKHADFMFNSNSPGGEILPIQASVFAPNPIPVFSPIDSKSISPQPNILSLEGLESDETNDKDSESVQSSSNQGKLLKHFPIGKHLALFFEINYQKLMSDLLETNSPNRVLLGSVTNILKRTEISIYLKPKSNLGSEPSGFKLEVISRSSQLASSQTISISLPNPSTLNPNKNDPLATSQSFLNDLSKNFKFLVYISSCPDQNTSNVQLMAFTNPESASSNSIHSYATTKLQSSNYLVPTSTVEVLGSGVSQEEGFSLERMVVTNSISHIFKTMLSSQNSLNKDICSGSCFLPAYECDALNPNEMQNEKLNMAKTNLVSNLNRHVKTKLGLKVFDVPGKCWLCPLDHVFNPISGKCEIFCHFQTKNVFGNCKSCSLDECGEDSSDFEIQLSEVQNAGKSNPVLEAVPSDKILFFDDKFFVDNFDLWVSENGQSFKTIPFDTRLVNRVVNSGIVEKTETSPVEEKSKVMSDHLNTQSVLIYVGYQPGSLKDSNEVSKEGIHRRILDVDEVLTPVVVEDAADSKSPAPNTESEDSTVEVKPLTTNLSNDTPLDPNLEIEISVPAISKLSDSPQSREYQLRLKPNKNAITASRNLIPHRPFSLVTPSSKTSSNPLITQLHPVQDFTSRSPTNPSGSAMFLSLPSANATALNKDLRIDPKFATCVNKVNDKLLKRLALSLFILVCIASLAYLIHLFVAWNVQDVFKMPFITTHLFMALIFIFHAGIFSQFYNFALPPSLHVFLRHLYYYSIRWHGAFRIPALKNLSNNSDFMADYFKPFLAERGSLSIVANIFLNYGVIMLILFVLFVLAVVFYVILVRHNKRATLSLQNWVEFLHMGSARYMLTVAMHLFMVASLVFSTEVCFFCVHQFSSGKPHHSLFVASLVFAAYSFIFHFLLVFLALGIPFSFISFIGKAINNGVTGNSANQRRGDNDLFPTVKGGEGQVTHFHPPPNSLAGGMKDTVNKVKQTFNNTAQGVRNMTGLGTNNSSGLIPRSQFVGSVHMHYPHEDSKPMKTFRRLYPFLFIVQGLRKGPIGFLLMGLSAFVFSIYGIVIGSAYKHPKFAVLFNLILIFLLFCYIVYASPGFNLPARFLLFAAYFIFFVAHLLLTILGFDPSSLSRNNGSHYCGMGDAIIGLFFAAVCLLLIGLIISMFLNEKKLAPLDIFKVQREPITEVKVGAKGNEEVGDFVATRYLESDDHLTVLEEQIEGDNVLMPETSHLRRPSNMISAWKSTPGNLSKNKNDNLEMIRSNVLRINQSTKRIETNISKFKQKYEYSHIPKRRPGRDVVAKTQPMYVDEEQRESSEKSDFKSEDVYIADDVSEKNSISPIRKYRHENGRRVEQGNAIDSADRKFNMNSPDKRVRIYSESKGREQVNERDIRLEGRVRRGEARTKRGDSNNQTVRERIEGILERKKEEEVTKHISGVKKITRDVL